MALENLGIEYIVAAKLKSLPKELKKEIISNKEGRSDKAKYWHQEYEFKNRRLIVSYTEDRKNKDE